MARSVSLRRLGLEEGLDRLLVVDDGERAGPVGAPQAALETPGIEDAGQRIPDVRERIRLARQRAGAADLDHDVRAPGEFEHLRQVGPRLRRRRRHARLQDAEMVDDEPCVGMAIDQRGARLEIAPAQQVDRKIVANGRAQDPVEAGVIGPAPVLPGQHDADADRARRLLPLGDDIGHIGIVGVDRLDDRHPAGMGPLHVHGVAGVIAVHRKRGDEDRAVDADLVHRRHHLVAGDVIGPVRHGVPRPFRRVCLIGMDLGIDNGHRGCSSLMIPRISHRCHNCDRRRKAPQSGPVRTACGCELVAQEIA